MRNKLAHLAEFEEILSDYHVSIESKKILDSTKLVLMVAPTSSGRNTIIKQLLKTGEYHYIVSDTTRHKRINDGVLEKDGVEYWFRSESDVLEDLRQGKYLEAAVIHNQQVSGISVRELDQAKHEGRIATTDIEIVGVQNIIDAKPDTIALFVLPPNFSEWQRRIQNRGHMHEEEYYRRLESAAQEFTDALTKPFYYFVINDSIKHVVEQIHDRAVVGKLDKELQKKGRELVKKLLEETNKLLADNKQA